MTTEELQKAYNPKSELEREVLEIIINETIDYENVIDWFNDLFRSGCISGMVASLSFYSDTLDFVRRHSLKINELLNNRLLEIGVDTPNELFEKWDEDDDLCLDKHNRNLLAWFAFEDLALKIVRELNFKEAV